MSFVNNFFDRLFCLKNLVFLCCGTVLLVVIGARITEPFFGVPDYIISEWIINYSTGFVRRGLGGSLLLWLQGNWNVSVANLIAGGGYVMFFVTAAYYCQRVFQLRSALPIHVLVIFLFLPSSIMMPILDPSVMGNKDFLFILSLILHIFIINRYTNQLISSSEVKKKKTLLRTYAITVAVVYNIAGIPIALMHEGILILSVPINLALTFFILAQVHSVWRSATMSVLIYSPTILVSLVIVLSLFVSPSVDQQRALAMCLPFDSIEQIDCDRKLPGAIQALMLSDADAYRKIYNRNLDDKVVLLTWIALILANYFLAVYAGVRCAATRLCKAPGAVGVSEQPSIPVGAIRYLVILAFLIPVVASIPLFVVAIDWGRWVFMTNISFLICAISSNHIFLPPGQRLLLLRSIRVCRRYQAVSTVAHDTRRSDGFRGFVVLLSVYVLSSTTLPHCCLRHAHVVDRVLTSGVIDQFVASGYRLSMYILRQS